MALLRIQRASVSTLEAIQPVHPVIPTRPVMAQPLGLAIDAGDKNPGAPLVERRRQADRRQLERRARTLPCLIDTRTQRERRQQRRRQDDPLPGGFDRSV